jgi:hypothetical protein
MFLRYGSNPLYPCVLGWLRCGVRLVASWAYITKLRVDQRCTRLVITERVCRSFRMSWPPCDKRVCYPGLYFSRLNVPSRHRRESVARARLIAWGDSLSLIDSAARFCRSPMAVDVSAPYSRFPVQGCACARHIYHRVAGARQTSPRC